MPVYCFLFLVLLFIGVDLWAISFIYRIFLSKAIHFFSVISEASFIYFIWFFWENCTKESINQSKKLILIAVFILSALIICCYFSAPWSSSRNLTLTKKVICFLTSKCFFISLFVPSDFSKTWLHCSIKNLMYFIASWLPTTFPLVVAFLLLTNLFLSHTLAYEPQSYFRPISCVTPLYDLFVF